MNQGIIEPPRQYAAMPRGLLGAPSQIPTPLGPPFAPASIPGLALWLDASMGQGTGRGQVSLNAGNVSLWRDMSGNGRDFSQATASAQPAYSIGALNGRNVLTFSSARSTSMAPASSFGAGQQKHLFFVASQTRRSGTDGYMGVVSSDFPGGTGIYLSTPTAVISGSFIDSNSTAAGALRVNGLPIASPTFTRRWTNSVEIFCVTHQSAATAHNVTQIGNHTGGARHMDGVIAEVILYYGRLTISEISQVERYLSEKWGLPLV